jgi:hypothetical protein
LFLHHRPLAATVKYRSAGKTEAFTEAVSASIRDMRSLGLLLPQDVRRTAENLRTIVFTHRTTFSGETEQRAVGESVIELVFVRARDASSSADSLQLHAFATEKNRTVLHYLNRVNLPASTRQCDITGTVVFTEFAYADLYPTKALVRKATVRSASRFDVSKLDAYVDRLGLGGDTFDNIIAVLDAIIDGKIR